MACYEAKKDELEALGVTVIAASMEDRESTVKMAEETGLTMQIAYGVTDDQVAGFDPWPGDDHHGHYLQPMEFLITGGGNIFGSMYATGPIGRMLVDEVIASVTGRERRRLEADN